MDSRVTGVYCEWLTADEDDTVTGVHPLLSIQRVNDNGTINELVLTNRDALAVRTFLENNV